MTERVLEERGLDISGQSSKGIDKFLGKMTVRYAIIVCENADENCPRIYPFAGHRLFWPFEDPAAATGSEAARLEKFREVREQIEERILAWLSDLEEEEEASAAAGG